MKYKESDKEKKASQRRYEKSKKSFPTEEESIANEKKFWKEQELKLWFSKKS